MLARYCGPGLLGLGVTALIAGFMSGMAGNVSAFATVWTYDIYRPYLCKVGTDAQYVVVGRWCTILGVILSIGTAYFVTHFKSIMDYMQALVSFFIAPLFVLPSSSECCGSERRRKVASGDSLRAPFHRSRCLRWSSF